MYNECQKVFSLSSNLDNLNNIYKIRIKWFLHEITMFLIDFTNVLKINNNFITELVTMSLDHVVSLLCYFSWSNIEVENLTLWG